MLLKYANSLLLLVGKLLWSTNYSYRELIPAAPGAIFSSVRTWSSQALDQEQAPHI